MSETPKTLADMPAPDETTCRRLVVLLGAFESRLPRDDQNSEPLEVRLP